MPFLNFSHTWKVRLEKNSFIFTFSTADCYGPIVNETTEYIFNYIYVHLTIFDSPGIFRKKKRTIEFKKHWIENWLKEMFLREIASYQLRN